MPGPARRTGEIALLRQGGQGVDLKALINGKYSFWRVWPGVSWGLATVISVCDDKLAGAAGVEIGGQQDIQNL